MVRASLLRIAGQVVTYGVFVAVVGYFATAPAYHYVTADEAVVKLTLAHFGERLGECRQLTEEELAELPPNMRKPMECPRERAPVTVEFDLDGESVFTVDAEPTGLHGDGMSYVYRSFRLATGDHRLTVRLRDDPDTQGFDYEITRNLHLGARQVLIIDFDKNDGFIFHGPDAPPAEET